MIRQKKNLIAATDNKKVVIGIFGVLAVVIAVTLVLTTMFDSIRFHIVHGTSMYPEYQPGDLVVAIKDKPSVTFDTMNKGDVIVYITRDPEFAASPTSMHRVMGSYIEPDTGIRSLITKGDNNEIAEPLLDYPIYEEDFLGKVVLKVPWVGIPRTWFDNPNTVDTLPSQEQMEEAFERR